MIGLASKLGRQNAPRLCALMGGLLLLALPAVQYEAGSLRAAEVSVRQSGAALRTTIVLLQALHPLEPAQRELAARASGYASYEALTEAAEGDRRKAQTLQETWEDLRGTSSAAAGVLYGFPALVGLALLAMGLSGWRNEGVSETDAHRNFQLSKSVLPEMHPRAQAVPPVEAEGGDASKPTARAIEDVLPLRQREFLVVSPRAVGTDELADAILAIDGRALGAENVYTRTGFDLIEIQTRSDASYFTSGGSGATGNVTTAWPRINQAVRLQVLLQISASAFLDDFEALALEVSTAIRAGKSEGASFSGAAGLFKGFAFRVLGSMAAATLADTESESSLSAEIRVEDIGGLFTEAEVDAYLASLTEEDLRAITLGSSDPGSDVGADHT